MNDSRIEMIRRIKLDLSGVKEKKFEDKIMENPCWDGYEPYGTKMVDGKEVPNCVPVKSEKVVKEGFPVPSPSGGEDEQTYIGRCMGEIGKEYEQEQALAICYSKWREG